MNQEVRLERTGLAVREGDVAEFDDAYEFSRVVIVPWNGEALSRTDLYQEGLQIRDEYIGLGDTSKKFSWKIRDSLVRRAVPQS